MPKNSESVQGADFIFQSIPPEFSKVDFINQIDPYGEINIINYLYAFNGGGVGIADLDNDGWKDLIFSANQEKNRIYFNKGDLSFEEGTLDSGLLNEKKWSSGISVVDINNDGLKDIYVCNVNNGEQLDGVNRLYINLGDRIFKESAAAYNLDIQALSTQAAFFDYDHDGDLDMYLLCHSIHDNSQYSHAAARSEANLFSGDRFYINENQKFIDASEKVGIFQSRIGYGLGIALGDLNNDGWTDIYITNDFQENDYLYLNKKGNGFKEVSNKAFSYTSKFSMGVDIADINNDGFLDILTLDMKPNIESVFKRSEPPVTAQTFQLKHELGYHYQYPKNTLQMNYGLRFSETPQFGQEAEMYGLDATDWSWAGLMEDFNMDGKKDIFISNGIYKRPNNMDYLNYISNELVQQQANDSLLISKMPSGFASNFLFISEEEYFVDQSHLILNNLPGSSNGASYGDLDNDGDLDIVLNNLNELSSILENLSDQDYVKIDLSHLTDAEKIGAKFWLYQNGEFQYRELQFIRGFLSTVSDEVIFGIIGESTIDSLIIQLPNQSMRIIYNITDRSSVDITKAKFLSPQDNVTPYPKEEDSTTIVHAHEEYELDEFVFDRLLLWELGELGPAIASCDLNNDKQLDYFIGGSFGSSGALYVSNESGKYEKKWETPYRTATTDAAFADFNNDGLQDLIIVSGDNQFRQGTFDNSDRIYLNNGNWNFTESYYYFDGIKGNSSCVAVSDFDRDGWQDIFIGSSHLTGTYGISPYNILLRNYKCKDFIEVTSLRSSNIERSGMVQDAEWGDLNNDGLMDLVLVGHWMPIKIYWNTSEGLELESVPHTSGLYNMVSIYDIDNDGKKDLLLGNIGINHDLSGDDGKLKLALNDYNRDSKLDAVFFKLKDGKEYTILHKDHLETEFNDLKKSFPKYREFSELSVREIFGDSIYKSALIKEVEEFRSFALLNREGNWDKVILPSKLQSGPIFSISKCNELFYAGGGSKSYIPQIGKMEANKGHAFSWDDVAKDFIIEKDLQLKGQVRSITCPNGREDSSTILIIRNDGPVTSLELD